MSILEFKNASFKFISIDIYKPFLNIRETEEAILFIKWNFQNRLAQKLNLSRASAPIAVKSKTGINDNLNGIEKPVSFVIKSIDEQAEIVQSLAKWKRIALADYGFKQGEGLYTDMNAIRPDEYLSNFHSIYVDQWDWERVISEDERNINFLMDIVKKIYEAIVETEKLVCQRYPKLPEPFLPNEINFIHSEELAEMFPNMTPREREDAICKDMGAVFIIGIGYPLQNGIPHDGRAADYDDWSTISDYGKRGLNGDILVHYPILNCAMELSSMGIRVDKNALLYQLELKNESYKKSLLFHQRLLNDELPLTIGGGIGQSRLCMLLLRKAHIGEVQSSIWPDEMLSLCKKSNIPLL